MRTNITQDKLYILARKLKQDFESMAAAVTLHDYIEIIINEPSLKSYIEYLEKQSKSEQEKIDMKDLKIIDVKEGKIVDNTWFFYQTLKSFYLSFEFTKKNLYKKEIQADISELGTTEKVLSEMQSLNFEEAQKEIPEDLFEKVFSQFHEVIMAKIVGDEFFNREANDGKLHFDENKSLLRFKNYTIPLSLKSSKTNAHYIIKYIFENDLSDEHFFSEIANSSDLSDDKSSSSWWRKYHHACEDIQNKMKENTNNEVSDFLVFSSGKTGSVRINPDYL